MSVIQIRGEQLKERIQKIMLESDDSPRVPFGNKTKFLNSHKRCMVCGGERTFDIQTRMIEKLSGHHVKYFPPLVAWVHQKCHAKIHDPENPMTLYIQYEEGDSQRYYKERKQRSYDKSTSEVLAA
jgi:hypothetical protein